MRLRRYVPELDHRCRLRNATQRWQRRSIISLLVLVPGLRHDPPLIESRVCGTQAYEDGLYHGLSAVIGDEYMILSIIQ